MFGRREPDPVPSAKFLHLIEETPFFNSLFGSSRWFEPALKAPVPTVVDVGLRAGTEIAEYFAGPIAGALLKAILARSEQTSKEMKLLLNEPFRTGIDTARRALAIVSTSKEDSSRLSADVDRAIALLDKAYTLAISEYHKDSELKAEGKRLYIRLVQGLLADRVGASGYAESFYSVPRAIIRHEVLSQLKYGVGLGDRGSAPLSSAAAKSNQEISDEKLTRDCAECFLARCPGIPERFGPAERTANDAKPFSERYYIITFFSVVAASKRFENLVTSLYCMRGRSNGLERLGLYPGGSGWRTSTFRQADGLVRKYPDKGPAIRGPADF